MRVGLGSGRKWTTLLEVLHRTQIKVCNIDMFTGVEFDA
jgi:hypothetical protein